MLYDVKTGDPSPVTEGQLLASWDGRPWPFPNAELKAPGSYVRNVHPCNVGRMEDGIVLGAEGGADEEGEHGTLFVRVGTGSTVYGPARNWRPITTAPAWLARAEAPA